MNVRRRTARATVVLATAALALGLSSCNYDNPTDMVYNPAVGVNAQSGSVDALNVLVVKRESTSDGGTLVATLVNNDQQVDDRLTGVTTGGDDQGVQVSLPGSIDVPAGDFVNLADGDIIEVTGETVQDGAFVTMTFTFANAESITVDAPVVIQDEGYFQDVPTS